MNKKVAFLIAFLFLNCINVFGCFCEGFDFANIGSANFSGYDEIFFGKVLSIERLEVNGKFDNGEIYSFVGTKVAFEVIKKWMGTEERIIYLYQDGSTCSSQFFIDGFDWVIGANRKRFTFKIFKNHFPEKYLMSDACSMTTHQRDKEIFDQIIQRLDILYSKPVKLEKNTNSLNKVIIGIVIFAGALIGIFWIRNG